MKTMTIIAALMAITLTMSAQTDLKPNYDVKIGFWESYVTADGVRINEYNALKLLPDSRNYDLWQKGYKAQQTSLYLSAFGLGLAVPGTIFALQDDPSRVAAGLTLLSAGLVCSIVALTQERASKRHWRELLVIR